MAIPLGAQTTPLDLNPRPEIQRQQLERAARLVAHMARKPKIVCGTTINPADPTLDRQAIKPEPDPKTKSTIRQVAPGACR